MRRSPEQVAALLGVLKTGACFVPLDPDYPAERLAWVLEHSGALRILTRGDGGELPVDPGAIPVTGLDAPEIAAQPSARPALRGDARSPAYLLYTSGSTGVPKGVLGLHRATLARFSWMWREYPFGEGERCCQRTSLGFGDAIWEIFGPLLCGVESLQIEESTAKDPKALVAELAAGRVTRIVVVPSLLQQLLEVPEDLGTALAALRVCTTSGEALESDLALRFRERLPHARLINLYGLTEVAADVACWPDAGELRGALAPIGRPIANTRLYVLGPHDETLPAGVVGELCVAGESLARGYLRRPDLTAERFLPDPFGAAGERCFRTGDLASFRVDGTLEVHGRIDRQVNVRGYRVEVAEVEAAIRRDRRVVEAFVAGRVGPGGSTRLAAYLVLEPGVEAVTVGEIQGSVRAQLPDYMVPSSVVFLAALPLTPSGKVDVRALPEPDGTRPALEETYVGPRNPVEEMLARVWSDLLEVERVGIHDNFFELGGHSLVATQVLSRVRESLRVDLPLRAIFDSPTVAELAEVIAELFARGSTPGRREPRP
jgi:amino acid adenylation domain-containing protein